MRRCDGDQESGEWAERTSADSPVACRRKYWGVGKSGCTVVHQSSALLSSPVVLTRSSNHAGE